MSEPLISELASDALFGIDGTESPEPLTEPFGRGMSGLPPLTLPPLPDPSVTREEIAAALGEDPTQPANQDPEAVSEAGPTQQDATPPGDTHTDTPSASASSVGAPPVPVPPTTAPPAAVTAPLPAHSVRPPTAGAPGRLSPSFAPMTAPPVPPTPGKRSGLRYRPPLAVGSRMVGSLDLRRRAGRRDTDLPTNLRSNGGATLFFLVAVLVCGLLMYGIITDMVASLSTLVP